MQGNSARKFREWAGDTRGGGDTMNDDNADCLPRSVVVCGSGARARQVVRAIGFVGLSGYKKVPGVGLGARSRSGNGNAAVYALSEIASKEAVGQLAILKVRVKFGTAQKEIGKAFDAAASALNLPRDQVEELSVPIYGLEEVGRRTEELGSYKAELVVSGSDAELNWFDADGKPLKSVPAKVKSEFKDDLKDLQQSVKDIQAMLPALARPHRPPVLLAETLAFRRVRASGISTIRSWATRRSREAAHLVRGGPSGRRERR